MDILFVCLGNICRSPMAEGIMRALFQRRGIEGRIDSAGTADWNVGSHADARAIRTCQDHGVDISGHRARQVQESDISTFDLLVVMDGDNEKMLRRMMPPAPSSRLVRIADFHPDSAVTEITDPYHRDSEAFLETYRKLEQACERLATSIAAEGHYTGRN